MKFPLGTQADLVLGRIDQLIATEVYGHGEEIRRTPPHFANDILREIQEFALEPAEAHREQKILDLLGHQGKKRRDTGLHLRTIVLRRVRVDDDFLGKGAGAIFDDEHLIVVVHVVEERSRQTQTVLPQVTAQSNLERIDALGFCGPGVELGRRSIELAALPPSAVLPIEREVFRRLVEQPHGPRWCLPGPAFRKTLRILRT